MKRIIPLIIMALCMATNCTWAQKNNAKDDYKIRKAIEVLEEEQDETKALKLLDEQLKDFPEDAEALFLKARILIDLEEYGKGLRAINRAMEYNRPKSTGIFKSTLYLWRSAAYLGMRDNGKAIEDLQKALTYARKDNPDNVQYLSSSLGRTLYREGRYEEATEVFNMMIKEDDADLEARVGLAMDMIRREKYTEAIEMLDTCEKFDSDYSEIYHFRMKAYYKEGNTDKAIEDAVVYLDMDDTPDIEEAMDILLSHASYSVVKLKAQINTTQRPAYLRAVLCNLYSESKDYALAVKEFDQLEADFGKDTFIYSNRAECYNELGLFNRAISDISAAIDLDDDGYYLITRGDFYRCAGLYEEAIADFTAAIKAMPDESFGYYRRGWCYELAGDDKAALKDYEMGIDIDQTYPYLYLMRAEQYLKSGDRAKAMKDLEQIIQMDTTANNGSCRQYALQLMGKNDEAIEWMNKIIEADPDDDGNYYDMACLLSKMGRTEEALEAFQKCLSMGYCSFGHIEHDDDLDAIRDCQKFKEALEKAKERVSRMVSESGIETEGRAPETVEIAFQRQSGGTLEIPCQINGLPLQMIFDTGASDVTISSVEADFMLKNKYLSPKDIKGKQTYQVADGHLTEGTIITLKEIKVGDAVLRNVNASVVKSQNAPILLGQSAMEKFGSFTIDNDSSILIIRR